MLPVQARTPIACAVLALTVLFAPHLAAYEVDLDLPAASPIATAGPDLFTGTMGATIPIEVPQGRRGIQPNLALAYRGGNGNGPVGVGWKLDLGGIERQSRFGVDFNGDAYVLKLNGVSMDLVPDPSTPGQYWAKIEGAFHRILKTMAGDGKPYWEVTDRQGTKYLFGQTTGARQDNPSNSSQIFKWCLDKILDPFGNIMKVTYAKDQGQIYVDQIDYATPQHSELHPYFRVRVHRAPIGTAAPGAIAAPIYVTGFAVTTTKLIKAIQIVSRYSAMYPQMAVYALGYNVSPQTLLPRLGTVQQFGKDATITVDSGTQAVTVTGPTLLPVQRLTYSTDPEPTRFVDQGSQPSSPCATGSPMGTADFNGDGRGDLWCHEYSGSAPTYIALANASGQLDSWSQAVSSGWCAQGYWFTTGDANGDGLADLICHGNATALVLLNTGAPVFIVPADGGIWRQNWCPGANGGNASGFFGVGDFDGDGRTDIRCLDGGVRVALSNGTAFTTGANGEIWRSAWCTAGDVFGTDDFNGDGRADIYCRTGGDYRVSLSNGTQFVVGPNSDLWRTGWCSGAQFNGTADFNGDGKADWYCRVENQSGPMWVQLSTGSSFVASAAGDKWSSAGWCWSGAQVGTGDFNGDGKADLFCHGSGHTWVGLSTGTIFQQEIVWQINWCPDGAPYAVRDINGDGKADVWCRESGGIISLAHSGSAGTGLPDSLMQIENGLGGRVTLTYGAWTPALSTGKPFTIQTVATLQVDDGNGITATTSYLYESGYYRAMQREFRGFHKVTVTGPPGPQGLPSEQRKTTVWFHQGNDLGLTNDPFVDDAYMRGKPYQITVADGQGAAYVERTITYTAGKSGKPYFFHPTLSVTTRSCDGGACASAKSRTRTYMYDEGYPDEYANITSDSQSGTGTTPRTIVRTFSPNPMAWIVSLPATEQVSEGPTVKSSTSFYYDQVADCGTAATQQQPTHGNVTRVVRGVSPDPVVETRMAYNKFGYLTCQRDANGHHTEFKYDLGSGASAYAFQLSSVQRYLNYPSTTGSQTTYFAYFYCPSACSGGINTLLKTITPPNGDTINFEYDALGRSVKKTVRFDSPSSATYVTAYAYLGWGTVGQQAIQTTDPMNLVTTTYFDGLRRTVKATSSGPDGRLLATMTEYEARGNARRQSIPYFQVTGQETPAAWTTRSYDLLGRPTKTVNPDQSTTLTCESNWVQVSVDPRGLRRVLTRDAFGRIIDVQEDGALFSTCDTSNQSAYRHVLYEHDILDNLLRVVDAQGNEVKFMYDSLGRRIELRDPDLGRWTYEYDPVGNLTKQTDGRGKVIHLQYDGLDRLKQQDYDTAMPRPLGDPSADVVYTYDGNPLLTSCPLSYIGTGGLGRLTMRKEVNGNEATYVYDKIGRVKVFRRKVSGDLRCNGFNYDGYDRLTRVYYYDNGRADYEYNGPWLKRVYEGSTNYAQFAGYNAAGQPAMLTLGNGVQSTYTYATESYGTGTCQQFSFRLCQLVATTGGGTTLVNQTYGYDGNANVTAITGPIGGNQGHAYDNQDRLMATSGPVWNTQLAFNEIDNLTYWAMVGHYAYPASQLGYGHHPHGVCATGATAPGACTGGTTQYTYDANGNMTGGAGRTLVYDVANRLGSVVTAGGTTSFVYDGEGTRVQKTVPTGGGGMKTVKYFDKWVECETAGGSTSCTKNIWAGEQRIAMKQVTGGAVTYYHADRLSSTAVVTNAAGTQQESIQYYPFGEQWTDTGTANVPYKYTGQEYDATTGLYFYKARYYDAHLGRFTQPDTIVPDPYIPAAWNRYAYALNNPLKYTDPTGHEALTDLGLYFTTALGFDYAGYNQIFAALSGFVGSDPSLASQPSTAVVNGGTTIVYQGGFSAFGYNGSFSGIIGSGVDEIASGLETGGQQVYRLNSGQLEDGIARAETAYLQGRMINEVGHSFGGDQAVDLSRALSQRGIPVNVLVTLDSVGFDNQRIPPNVSVNVNFYQDGLPLPRPLCICGAANFAEDPNRTQVINVPRPEGHFEIANSFVVRKMINQLILGRP